MNDFSKCKIAFAIIFLLLAYNYAIIEDIIRNRLIYFAPGDDSLTNSGSLNNENLTNIAASGERYGTIESDIIKSWKNFIVLPKRDENTKFKIAIGLNTNVDLILSATSLLNQLEIKSGPGVNHKKLNSLVEFKECFKYFFRKGSAAERSLTHLSDFDQILEKCNLVQEKQWFIGGNAALMAQGISNRFDNVEVLLVGPVGPRLKHLLNKMIQVPSESLIEKDEIHLILEYHANESYEGVNTKAANRFIVSHDVLNSRMELMNTFFQTVDTHKPELIILSGLHLIESQDEAFRLERLQAFKKLLVDHVQPRQAVHLELASIGDISLMKSILELNIFALFNSIGLNEQELMFLAHSSNGMAPHGNYYHEINGQPDIVKVIDILEWTLLTHGRIDATSKSKLTRIHFHCLIYHIIAVIEPSEWSNTGSSLMSGSKIAAKQACGFDFNDVNNENDELAKLLEFKMTDKLINKTNIRFQIGNGANDFIELNSTYPIGEFKRGSVKFYFTPVLVCKSPLKTVGLGDAISSNGLFYASFNPK